ncbi:hypothetical protein [Priestia abyssalis]|uniref:hypothetical protein n=1 Tax=Priestia abyssalis TaxID=1221450 RepID=UPI000994C970|nr:hypothetical protein [Priestia abyssalis]
MKTITVQLQIDEQAIPEDKIQVKLAEHLKGTEFDLISFTENDEREQTDSTYAKMHASLPSKPDGVDPDINSAGAGGQVSPDSSGYPKIK